jgi:hypothetical protein
MNTRKLVKDKLPTIFAGVISSPGWIRFNEFRTSFGVTPQFVY